MWVRHQKRARLDFGTKLGMNSPFWCRRGGVDGNGTRRDRRSLAKWYYVDHDQLIHTVLLFNETTRRGSCLEGKTSYAKLLPSSNDVLYNCVTGAINVMRMCLVIYLFHETSQTPVCSSVHEWRVSPLSCQTCCGVFVQRGTFTKPWLQRNLAEQLSNDPVASTPRYRQRKWNFREIMAECASWRLIALYGWRV